jgi:hypothetical protein
MDLVNILRDNDFSRVIDYPNNLGNGLSRGECEDICQQEFGVSIPRKTVRFLVRGADDKYFFVVYVKDWDKFLFEKLTAR